jgi:microcystin-dependent protein
MTSVLTDYDSFKSTGKPTAGDTKLSLAGVDHSGWLICDGRTLNISQYYYLFQVIGTTYGFISSTTFKLPNPAGRVLGVIGSGVGSNGQPLSVRTAGQLVGEETHILTIDEMPTHGHSITDPGHNHTYVNQPNQVSPAVSLTTTDVADNVNVSQTTSTSTTGISINSAGGSNGHNTMQPTLFIGNMFIYSGKPHVGAYAFTGNGIY